MSDSVRQFFILSPFNLSPLSFYLFPLNHNIQHTSRGGAAAFSLLNKLNKLNELMMLPCLTASQLFLLSPLAFFLYPFTFNLPPLTFHLFVLNRNIQHTTSRSQQTPAHPVV